ncbi:MAG: hypothetical protein ABH864_05285 [archaeon]
MDGPRKLGDSEGTGVGLRYSLRDRVRERVERCANSEIVRLAGDNYFFLWGPLVFAGAVGLLYYATR